MEQKPSGKSKIFRNLIIAMMIGLIVEIFLCLIVSSFLEGIIPGRAVGPALGCIGGITVGMSFMLLNWLKPL